MCTYNLTLNDSLLEGAKRSFPDQAAITAWMEQQIERLLRQISVDQVCGEGSFRKIEVSDRIKALSAVPPCSSTADYKDEIVDIMSSKYFSSLVSHT